MCAAQSVVKRCLNLTYIYMRNKAVQIASRETIIILLYMVSFQSKGEKNYCSHNTRTYIYIIYTYVRARYTRRWPARRGGGGV